MGHRAVAREADFVSASPALKKLQKAPEEHAASGNRAR